jgi:glycosyltransferase involved in cell wall biosynthesis
MRLGIIVSHPTQYYSPWFRHIAKSMEHGAGSVEQKGAGDARGPKDQGAKALQPVGLTGRREDGGPDPLPATSNSPQNALRVFYLWDFGVTKKTDKGFGQTVKWDVDLLEGYDHEFVPNVSKRPGTDWFGGLDNPQLLQRVKAFAPNAVLQFGYNYKSLVNFDLRWNTKRAPLLFRGDSHLLAEGEQGIRHEAYGIRLRRWVRGMGLRWLFKRFACFLAVGKANADYFRAHGVPESKIVRCPHVVDNAFFLGKNASMERGAGSSGSEEGGRHGPKEQETERPKDQESKRPRDKETAERSDTGRVSDQQMEDQKAKRPRGLREELGIPEDELVFLFAGKLEEKKQPLLLLEAFLAADIPRATLLFVGSGELANVLQERVRRGSQSSVDRSQHLKTEDCQPSSVKREETGRRSDQPILLAANSAGNVRFLPFQNQSRMPEVYRTGDVLVLPSKGRYETWGLAVNEAACCGLPAIVSSHVGCGPDLVEDGVTGWIFEAGNVVALQRALETAAANRGRLPAMGEALRERVLAEYSYANATEALLRRLRSEKGEPRMGEDRRG